MKNIHEDFQKYLNFDVPEMVNYLKDDGVKWSEAFFAWGVKGGYFVEERYDNDFISWVHGWFANAIERGKDEYRWKQEEAQQLNHWVDENPTKLEYIMKHQIGDYGYKPCDTE